MEQIDTLEKQTLAPRFWKRHSVQEKTHAIIVYALLIGIGLVIVLPMSWMLTAALRADGEIVYTIPVSWFPTDSFHFENFWRVITYEAYPLWKPALNSVMLVALNIVGSLISNSLVGYAFARLDFPGKEFLFRLVILTMLMPGVVLLVPSFLLFNALGWYGSFLPLWVPSFFTNAFFVFITRQYMRTFPRDLDDAARIDGCSYFGVYWRIIMPMSKPVLTVIAVFQFLWTWNAFTEPLIYLNDTKKFTLAIALDYFRRSAFSSAATNTTNLVMAATLLSILPMLILYFFAQKQLIGGIASVGLKG